MNFSFRHTQIIRRISRWQTKIALLNCSQKIKSSSQRGNLVHVDTVHVVYKSFSSSLVSHRELQSQLSSAPGRLNLMSMEINNKKCYRCDFRQVESRWNPYIFFFFFFFFYLFIFFFYIRVFTLSVINQRESNINNILREIFLRDVDLLRLAVRINGDKL